MPEHARLAPPGPASAPAADDDPRGTSVPVTQDVLDALPAAIYTTDPDGRVTSFNKACVTFSGRIPELGTDRWCVTWKLFHPDGRPMPFDQCPMAVALKEGRSISGAEAIAERPDGSRIWFAAHPTPLYADDGRMIGGVNMLVDITARKESELSLQRGAREQTALYRFTDRLQRASNDEEIHEAALDAIIEGLGAQRAAVLLIASDGVMRFVAWHGLSDEYRAAVEGHSPWEPGDPDPEPVTIGDVAASDLGLELKAVIAREGIGAVGFIPLVGDGMLIGKFMLYYDAPHEFEDADLGLAVTIARQLAFALGRHWADLERRATSQALVEADRRKDEFLATLAHELRNPLGPIHSALPLIKRSVAAGEDPARWHSIVSRQTERLTRLVDDLMDVSRITRGHIELRSETIDLADLAGRVVDAHGDEARTSGLSLERQFSDEPMRIEGDPMRLEQVVANLLSNAIKYTEAGGAITVRLTRVDDTAELSVRDTGIGIDPTFRRRIFTLFEQADRSLDRSKGGLGIGLTLARQLVELHGGTVDCDSDGLGRGSTFTVRLPIAEKQRPAAVEDSGDATATTPVSAAVFAGRRRVLLVDDNDDYAEVLSEFVEQLGHEVRVAHDGLAAVRMATDAPPDVVILDIGLPGLSGYDVAERLRALPATRGALLVAVSGYGQPSDRERSARSGIDAHIVKPIDLPMLEQLLASSTAAR